MLPKKHKYMAIYKFRILLEDYEGIYRDIIIKSSQTFDDLHYTLLQAFNFDLKHDASFFFSDDLWHQLDEVAYKNANYDVTSDALPMNKAKISDFIDDPHQRFLYLYDFEENWTFLLELIDIQTAVPSGPIPAVVKVEGEAPKQYKQVVQKAFKKDESPAPLLLDDDLLPDFDEADKSENEDNIIDTFNIVTDEELSTLESEEGEEETEKEDDYDDDSYGDEEDDEEKDGKSYRYGSDEDDY